MDSKIDRDVSRKSDTYSLEGAIEDAAAGSPFAADHDQLLSWLRELKRLRLTAKHNENRGVLSPSLIGKSILEILQEGRFHAHESDVLLCLDMAIHRLKSMRSTVQEWVHDLPRMQQAVMLGAVRGPDGVAKDHQSKDLVRWYRRCLLITAFSGEALTQMHSPGGGDFTGPVGQGVLPAKEFFKAIDSLPFHYVTHFVAAAQIMGYTHPVNDIRIFWSEFYLAWCRKIHVMPERFETMNQRLGDKESVWRDSE